MSCLLECQKWLGTSLVAQDRVLSMSINACLHGIHDSRCCQAMMSSEPCIRT
jgi:hypothetical protein